MPGLFACGRKSTKAATEPLKVLRSAVEEKSKSTPAMADSAGRWRFSCIHVEGASTVQLAALPSASVGFEVGGGTLVVGRSLQAIEDLLAFCPENRHYLSRQHAQLSVQHRGRSRISVTNLSENVICVDSQILAKGESATLAHEQTISFARPERGGAARFLVFQVFDQALHTSQDCDDALTTVRLSDDIRVSDCTSEALKRWQLRCIAAEGLHPEDLENMPEDVRLLTLVDGTAFIGRRHQPKFFSALLVGAVESQQFVSRTHAELSIRTENNESSLWVTNRSANLLFVGDKAVCRSQSSSLTHGEVVSFARPGDGPSGLPVRVLTLQVCDPSEEVALARAETALPDMLTFEEGEAPRMSIDKTRPPLAVDNLGKDDAFTMIFTDVQGSTSLWEADPGAMEVALSMHDDTIRRVLAKHHGYEVTTEGDAFQMAFHDAIDAARFCLECQAELLTCDWPAATLAHPAAPSEDGAWRGLRVRMGVHSGAPGSVTKHEVTGRLRYAGPNIALAKAVEGTCHGGQIVLSAASFAQINGALTQLGSPQVIDLGEHELENPGLSAFGAAQTLSCGLFQLLPVSLAHDFGRDAFCGEPSGGRLFPAPLSVRRSAPGFAESPAGSEIVLCFAFAHGAKALNASVPELAAEALGLLNNCVRKMLREACATGYECQEDEGAFMLAFGSVSDAVAFAYALQRALPQLPWNEELKACGPKFAQGLRVALGLLAGGYTSRKPHVSTGRADYFGTIVNRAARIAAAANAGQVLIGGEAEISLLQGAATVVGQQPLPCHLLQRLGPYALKGVACPLILHQVRVADEDGNFEQFPEPKAKKAEPDLHQGI